MKHIFELLVENIHTICNKEDALKLLKKLRLDLEDAGSLDENKASIIDKAIGKLEQGE